ncbi:MAG: glycogen/starch/alpha-glucan phosphorylase [Chlamydiales bacterium]|nr:glycogen/starch/alpha-glucan phosphorylase [Chlamydiales bacterium]
MAKYEVAHEEELRNDADSLRKAILEHLHFNIGKDKYTATKRDIFYAICYTVRDHLIDRWMKTQRQYYENDAKRVYYLSMEFLIGRTLRNSLVNLGLLDNCYKAVHDFGFNLDNLFEIEMDAGLGNGGLGRLAACFLDSMATLNIPGYGYGIRYDYGIFTQKIQNGYQVETPDNWLRYGNPWEMCRSEYLYPVQFYGTVSHYTDAHGKLRTEWKETQEVVALPYDIPVPGYGNNTVNTLRLWQAKSSRGFDFTYFNHGDYIRAVEDIALTENITRVLYPNDNIFEGQELRLKQEYLLVAATIQDIIRRYNKGHVHLEGLPDKVAIQLNDTHPALAIAEMMRLLVDREELSWEKAWHLTTNTFGYTNHTLLPEALERWSVELLSKVLPRHIEIIYEINQRWLDEVERQHPGNDEMKRKLSIIEGNNVNMAHLAIVGTHKVNGVSALHSELLKHQTFKEFYSLNPDKFTNKTNGITPRRWLKECNTGLAHLVTSKIGEGWITNLDELLNIAPFADDASFREAFMQIKRDNKEVLAKEIFAEYDVPVNLDSLFDVQAKRMHEYKRQLLNLLHVIHLYNKIKENPKHAWTPRTVIISGKAAPGYMMAKLIIKLITSVGDVINNDSEAGDYLKLFFLSNYRVSLAERLIPAADLSEQISTAGTEASGTGNMKFALNGALTIGTLDGANIEIAEEVGEKNLFIFGLKTPEVVELKKSYNPRDYYDKNPDLKKVIDQIGSGFFSYGDQELFKPIVDSLLNEDTYCLLADFEAYVEAQRQAAELYKNRDEWAKKAILNVAHMGKFSSDRTIENYASEIWRLS